MVDWIKLEKDDLNGLSYRTAKPEEKAILLDLIGLAMIEDIELPYNSIDNLIQYEELANLLNVKPTSLANTIRRFGNFIKIERTGDVIKIKITFIEIAKGKISEKSDKAKNASKARWGKEKEEKTECTSNANAMQTHNASNANAMQMECRVDKNRVDKNRKEENKKEENILNTSRGEEKKINKKEKEIFLPPTQPEVIEYLLSKSEEYANLANYSICEQIAKKYTTHFEAESWVKVNNKPIRSWKLDLNKRLEGDWLAPHLFKPKTESKAVAQWAQMVNNAQDRVVQDIMNEMRQKGKV